VVTGTEALREAKSYQKKSRKCMMIAIIILLVIAIIVGGVRMNESRSVFQAFQVRTHESDSVLAFGASFQVRMPESDSNSAR